MIAITVGLVCFIFGYIIGRGRIKGDMVVDQSIPDEAPYLFLELYENDLHEFNEGQKITFKVVRKNYIPRD